MDRILYLEKTVKKYYKIANEIRKKGIKKENSLPGNCYFINETDVLCFERKDGVSRHPFSFDGLTIWARSSGYISAIEADKSIFRFIRDGEEPCIAFFGGIKNENGYFDPVSVTGVATCRNDIKAERFSVFTPAAAYYITECKEIIFAVMVSLSAEKNIQFSFCAINLNNEQKEIYMFSYFDPLLRKMDNEDFESRWFKSSIYYKNRGFIIHTSKDDADYLSISFKNSQSPLIDYVTTARSYVTGGTDRSIEQSEMLISGKFNNCVEKTEFWDNAVASIINRFKLSNNSSIQTDFSISDCLNENIAIQKLQQKIDIEKDVRKCEVLHYEQYKDFKVEFSGKDVFGKSSQLVNRFISSVQRQVYFCAMGKNYCGPKIGIRDVYQQLEAACMWCPRECGEKLIKYLEYISPDGRAARQITVNDGKSPFTKFDVREFIDQGIWIISAFYTYISYTGDYSILNRKCGYYSFNATGDAERINMKDSALEHLIKIESYLEKNIDPKTRCLRILYGDWNDAVDGLGHTDNKNMEFGSGVSVMATLQFYNNLYQLSSIIENIEGYKNLSDKYIKLRFEIEKALIKYAVVKNDKGETKILHGWGDERNYLIGSYEDVDGKSRDSLTANAFWVLCGMLTKNMLVKKDLLSAFQRLDSIYGLKTFEPKFEIDYKKVGRIGELPAGTAENAATYIHASLFAVMALFKMGESEKGWQQLKKLFPFTHENITSTPYVMPNSYCRNIEWGIDGYSMSDWHTGSGAVLLRIITEFVFGIQVNTSGVKIAFPKTTVFKKGKITLPIKECVFILEYDDTDSGKRLFEVNGEIVKSEYDDEFKGLITNLPNEIFKKGKQIKVNITD